MEIKKSVGKSIKKVVVVKSESKDTSCSILKYAEQAQETAITELAQAEFLNKLEQASALVAELGLKFTNGKMEGRQVSKKNEWQVTGPITDKFKWAHQVTKDRDSGDFYIKTAFGYFGVNVKIIKDESKAYNNICGPVKSAAQLLYNCTVKSSIDLAVKMKEEEFTKVPQNYGILVVNKGTGEVKNSSLFTLNNVVVNPSNGLQFSMEKMASVKRTQLEGQCFIFDKMIELYKVRALPYGVLNG